LANPYFQGLASVRQYVTGVDLRSLIAAAAFLAVASGAKCGTLDCTHVVYDDDLSSLSLGRVSPGGRANFLLNALDRKSCPLAAPECRSSAFLLPGDAVVFNSGFAKDGVTCVTFIDRRGQETSGWLPAARVAPASSAPNWIGRWKRNASAEINITLKSGGKAEVDGSATWGLGAAMRDGGVSAVIDTAHETQAFASNADGPIPFEKAGQYDCAVRLRQLGPYLFAADNQSCGGANVSFTGLYRRR
jgi:hypothetical protein